MITACGARVADVGDGLREIRLGGVGAVVGGLRLVGADQIGGEVDDPLVEGEHRPRGRVAEVRRHPRRRSGSRPTHRHAPDVAQPRSSLSANRMIALDSFAVPAPLTGCEGRGVNARVRPKGDEG